MTIKEYAQLRGVHTTGVIKALKKGWNAPGIKSAVQQASGDWVLKVDVKAMEQGVNFARRTVKLKNQ